MSIRLSCPSCNHGFALPAPPDHRRAACPRCGDVFPIRSYTEVPDEAPATSLTPAKAPGVRPPPRRWLLALACAVPLGLFVYGFYWMATNFDNGTRDVPSSDPPRAAAANELAGLGYLRADSNVVFAVQGGPLLRYAGRTGRPPGEVLAQTGLPEPVRGAVEQLGVPLERVDHLAGGLTLGEGEDALRFTLALVLTEPLADEDDFLRKLKARPVAGKGGRHDVVLGRLPLVLARAAPTVWVFGLDERDLAAVEKGGAGGAPLLGVLASLPPEAAVWVAADSDRDWTQKPAVKLLGGTAEGKKLLPVLTDGRGAALAVSLGAEPRLWLRVRAADDATGARVRAYFGARAAEVGSARAGGEGAVAQFESPFGPDTGKLLQRFLADAGR